MTINYYYRFEKVQNIKTKYVLNSYSRVYEPLHRKTNKNEIVLYVSNNTRHINTHTTNFDLTIDGKKMSKGIKTFHTGINLEFPTGLGVGDFEQDIILINYSESLIEIFISENNLIYKNSIYSEFLENEYLNEIELLKSDLKYSA